MSKEYAVINTGSKQYVVSQGDILRIETVGKEKGEEITFTPIAIKNGDLLVTDKEVLKDKSVKGTVVRNGRAKKIVVFKMKRRKD
ncbi:MAG: 50S ribosomal protein L21, partial [Deltaproteobacteria bacterium]|nr:50S ribosomal protein L21 [Deltaproteobacteria bacterium]